ncbi:protein-glutamine gamma-glutamyltransferase [Shouchella clausii]|uniref:Protein-glutamine gamma-glutamyltransferase n=2 Tax=Shouchella clausii TaxID=79880 RepID=A0A268S3V4_SHOCL|nr:protein-glutamine gamma-glutamyltransferase [Shouchella clausii]PAD44705.1 protein-glutamine gamma-glutamyltransferase [Bacillus sp. 7520-S]PAD17942.1 protein-glutamine gamma-glutamyltransferase [Shouchella clausii]PAE86342.1 protein-glutamine gamma-glutamyltransferase [Shouchella clausii]PAE98738.1 protein-glutamine gamma-glutamyltransferase [Shouchella clausii]
MLALAPAIKMRAVRPFCRIGFNNRIKGAGPMIEIAGKPLQTLPSHGLSQAERAILTSLLESDATYRYQSVDELSFEVALRLHTVEASMAMFHSGASFESFQQSYCNPRFWQRMPNGAFQLKPSVRPSDAINDIFLNGRAYGFECATAIIILFYKAVLDSIDRPSFDRLFQGLYLYSWEHDEDLQLVTRKGTDYCIGDCVYFNNPDFAPYNSVWRGENAIKLDRDLYFGHGIGIQPSAEIIRILNEQRIPGSQTSAYLLDQVTRLNFKLVRTFSATGYTPRTGLVDAIVVEMGDRIDFY